MADIPAITAERTTTITVPALLACNVVIEWGRHSGRIPDAVRDEDITVLFEGGYVGRTTACEIIVKFVEPAHDPA